MPPGIGIEELIGIDLLVAGRSTGLVDGQNTRLCRAGIDSDNAVEHAVLVVLPACNRLNRALIPGNDAGGDRTLEYQRFSIVGIAGTVDGSHTEVVRTVIE